MKCVVHRCDRPAASYGYCDAHYLRVRRHGHPQADVPIRVVNRSGHEPLDEPVNLTEAHPVAAARLAAGLPPRTRVERLLALAELAESRPSPGEYEAQRARILEGSRP